MVWKKAQRFGCLPSLKINSFTFKFVNQSKLLKEPDASMAIDECQKQKQRKENRNETKRNYVIKVFSVLPNFFFFLFRLIHCLRNNVYDCSINELYFVC